MSVYRDTAGTVSFKHPIGTPLTATFTDATGAVVDTQTGIASVAGVYTAQVKWQLTQYDAQYRITWTDGSGFSRTQSFEVVTPIVDLSELRTIWTDGSNPTDDEVAEVEQAVRAVVQTYTGQPFGYSVGTQNYIGNGSGKFLLKQRVNKLMGALGGWSFYPSDYIDPNGNTNLNGELNLDRCAVIEDGWTFLIEWPQYLTVKESPPMELINLAPSEDGTIRVPRRFYARKDEGVQYSIYAEWGYAEVPDEVQEAAMLLANDYITNDSQYRDRYLEILKIQQDSFTYHPGAFRGTGNARADLLLGPYRRQTGMIIL